MSVLYIITCGSTAAARVTELVSLAQGDSWDVCVVTTPDGRRFVDVTALEAATGHPVRSEYKNPGEPDLLPEADAMVVAPATVNTINKWAAGIADTLALGLLVEGYGKGLPMVALPYTNAAMAVHPTFLESITRLRSWGVIVVHGEEVSMPSPTVAESGQDDIPWHLALQPLVAGEVAGQARQRW